MAATATSTHGARIAVDLPTIPPAAQNTALVADRVVTLQTPLGTDAAMSVLRAFFRAVIEENTTALGAVVAPDAIIQDLPESGAPPSREARRALEARSFWARRFRQRDYGGLAEQLIFRESEVEIFRAGSFDRAPSQLRSVAREKLDAMAETDIVLRVPIVTPSVRSEQLFGKELYLWMGRSGDSYAIYHLAEPFPF